VQVHLAPIGLTHYCDTSLKLIFANMVLSRKNVHSTWIAHFQRSCCEMFMFSTYVNSYLLIYVDARDLIMTITVYVDIST
jgi:hypothetical protein